MGAFLSHPVGKLLRDSSKPPDGEIDHNIVVRCGPLTVAEHEKDVEQERKHDD